MKVAEESRSEDKQKKLPTMANNFQRYKLKKRNGANVEISCQQIYKNQGEC